MPDVEEGQRGLALPTTFTLTSYLTTNALHGSLCVCVCGCVPARARACAYTCMHIFVLIF